MRLHWQQKQDQQGTHLAVGEHMGCKTTISHSTSSMLAALLNNVLAVALKPEFLIQNFGSCEHRMAAHGQPANFAFPYTPHLLHI